MTDHAGTPQELCNEKGQIDWHGEQDLWGTFYQCTLRRPPIYTMEHAANDQVFCDLRYQGQLEDKESGLYYNLNRYYDADSGQYLSPDPIGFAGGLRPQAYVDNPMEYVDPLGLAKGCPDGVSGLAGSINWKGFNPQKRNYVIEGVTHNNLSGLQYHYIKHGKEFGDITQSQYLNKAKDFAKKPLNETMQEARVNNIIIRHDKATSEIFVGHAGKREMRTYYIDDGRDSDAFKAAIKLAKDL